jgi:hypothetical protein
VASTVARVPDDLNNNCSIWGKHSMGAALSLAQTGFGMSTHTCSISNRCASQSPSARTPKVSVA